MNIRVSIGQSPVKGARPAALLHVTKDVASYLGKTETFDMGIVFTVNLSFPSSLYNLNNGPIEKGLLCFFCLPVEEISAVVLTGIFIPENTSYRSDLKMYSILKLCIHIFFA